MRAEDGVETHRTREGRGGGIRVERDGPRCDSGRHRDGCPVWTDHPGRRDGDKNTFLSTFTRPPHPYHPLLFLVRSGPVLTFVYPHSPVHTSP